MEKLICLLIDDDPEEIEIFQMAMTSFPDIQLDYFLHSPVALLSLEKKSYCPHYIFIDLNMPGLKGSEVISRLRKIRHLFRTPIYTYTNSSLEQDRNEVMKAGASGFITKPTKLGLLIDILHKIFFNE